MATVLFVHGTGVRKASLLETMGILQDAFDFHAIPHQLEACPWGDDLGSKIPHHSIPGGTEAPQPSADVVRWDLLYRDPLFELRLLKNRPKPPGPVLPNAPNPGKALWTRVSAYQPEQDVARFLVKYRLHGLWNEARKWVLEEDEVTKEVLEAERREIGEPGQATAHAFVAALQLLAENQDRPLLSAAARDELVDLLLDAWEARVAGIGKFLAGFFEAAITPVVAWKRGDISNASSFAAADILLYQARGSKIRRRIRDVVCDLKTDVYLLAHSLGGIACVDLLAVQDLPNVKGLITAGSQAPLLYETGALWSLKPDQSLPAHFPPWLNLWDPYDFLSYLAAPVFPAAANPIDDKRIQSGQPFPQSHSAYWTHADTWHEIKKFLR